MNARQELESLAREIAELEGYGITFARRLAAEQWERLLGFAVDWDAMVAAQQAKAVSVNSRYQGEHQACNTSLIGEQRAVNQADVIRLIGEQHAV